MKNKKHIDFLNDDKFVEWRLFQTEELSEYWAGFIKQNPHREEEFKLAIEKFKSVRLNSRTVPEEEKDKLLNSAFRNSTLKARLKRIGYYCSVAACLVLLAVLVVFIQQGNKQDDKKVAIIGNIMPSEDIQLISGNMVIDMAQNADLMLNSQGKVSIMEKNEIKSSEYKLSGTNRLIVPYGKRSTLVLPDGTKVWLNSGSELEFPAGFEKNERRVNVKGEVFIDVAEDKAKPFYVDLSQFSIRVYGTSFNVSSYNGSEESVILVTGKIEVESGTKSVTLYPNELYSLNSGIEKHKKVNVEEYISWKDGVFVFNEATVYEILKKIERYYNVSFKDSQSRLMSRTCTGKLYLSEDIEHVMEVLSVISDTKYERSGNTISIIYK